MNNSNKLSSCASVFVAVVVLYSVLILFVLSSGLGLNNLFDSFVVRAITNAIRFNARFMLLLFEYWIGKYEMKRQKKSESDM